VNERLGPLIPEIALAAGAVAGLLAGSWLPRRRQWVIRLLAAAACLVALAATAFTAAGTRTADFGTSYAIDVATNTVRVVVAAATLLVIGLSAGTVQAHKRETEFYVLLLLAALGTIVLAGANDLLLLFAGYLLASVPAYALAGFAKDSPGTEAALKYYLMGALAGVAMLTGVTLLYGTGRTTSYPLLQTTLGTAPHGAVAAGVIAVTAGLLFKSGAVPAHFWVPDVADGTTLPVAAFVTTVPKLGGLAALFRLLAVAIPAAAVNWPLLIAILAAASMTLGNLAAFFQDSVKRLLAYSTISQAGYLLMAVAVATPQHHRRPVAAVLPRRLRRHQPGRVRRRRRTAAGPHHRRLPRAHPPAPRPGRSAGSEPARPRRHPAHRSVPRQAAGIHHRHRRRLRLAHRPRRRQHRRQPLLLPAVARARVPARPHRTQARRTRAGRPDGRRGRLHRRGSLARPRPRRHHRAAPGHRPAHSLTRRAASARVRVGTAPRKRRLPGFDPAAAIMETPRRCHFVAACAHRLQVRGLCKRYLIPLTDVGIVITARQRARARRLPPARHAVACGRPAVRRCRA